MIRIGVLALQGAVREHMSSVEACGVEAVAIKRKEATTRSGWPHSSWWRKYSNATFN